MFDELYQAVKLRFGDVNASQSMGDWICANTTIKKRPFSFDGYAFQKAIADDMHSNVSVIKCSQIGLTEVQIRKFLAILTRSTALNGIFSLPNEAMFTRTYNGRIKPVMESDAVFNPPVSGPKPTRSKNQVQIRDSFGYISGCTEGDATNTSADFVFHDELDLSPETIIALYQSRLQGSDMRMVQQFSTPTFTGVGIHKSYLLTDQREYTSRCPACRHVQIPRFTPEFVHLKKMPFDVERFTDLTAQQIAILDLEDCYIRCEKCSVRLDMGDADQREWVATKPSIQNFRGYRVRPFSTPRIKPAYVFGQLAQYQERSFTRGFYNTVLGEEYDAANARLQEDDIKFCMSRGTPSIPTVSSDIPCFMGIDVGMVCYITISYDDDNGFPVFCLFDQVSSHHLQRRVDELMRIYNIVQGAVDRFPYTTEADALRDNTHGLIIPVQYRGQQALSPVFEADTKVLNHYSANNTHALDRVRSMVGQRQAVISGYQGQSDLIIQHLTSMVRDDKPVEGGDTTGEWKKTNGNDHYMHSMAFNLIARRVCEHMYSTQVSTVATTSSFLGASFGATQGMLNFSGEGKMTGLNRIARLG